MQQLRASLLKLRFELFFGTMMAVLFGSLFFEANFYIEYVYPILFFLNVVSGIILISYKKRHFITSVLLFIMAITLLGLNPFVAPHWETGVELAELTFHFVFYSFVTIQIIKQVWQMKEVDANVIIGLMSGYVALGLMSFFIFFTLETIFPGSFKGLGLTDINPLVRINSLLYYSFITLMTIGYGEIYPITIKAQKAAILVGLMGQFYLVIITAVVIEKYIRAKHPK